MGDRPEEPGPAFAPAPDTSALEEHRAQMFLWRARFLLVGLPAFLLWAFLPVLPGLPAVVTTAWGTLAPLLVLALVLLELFPLYQFAREAGGARYAVGHLLLAFLLFPIGPILVPLLLDSDVGKGIPRWRRATARPAWFVMLDTLVVMLLLGMAVGLTAVLGLPGLLLGALLVPLFYGGFVLLTRPRIG